MRVEEIKENYSMQYILDRCGLEIKRGGFCRCPFHSGDNTPSMKVYKNSFYCFACGKGGDQIAFVQLYHNLNFKEACEWISGESLTRESKLRLAVAEIRRKEKEKTKKQLEKELKTVNKGFSGLWEKLHFKPFSDEWTNAYNKWQLLCYQQEEILSELGKL